MNKIAIFILPPLISACSALPSHPHHYLKSQDIAWPTQSNFPHCYNYGCDIVVNVEFSEADWKRIEATFIPQPQNAEEERNSLASAIGSFERIVGKKTGTEADQFGTFRHIGQFQQDCIDESTNTTIYLSLLQERELLRFHITSAPDTRLPLIHAGRWPHRTAVIYNKQSLKAFAVDSWFHDNGFPAEVVPLTIWKKGWKAGDNFRRSSDSQENK